MVVEQAEPTAVAEEGEAAVAIPPELYEAPVEAISEAEPEEGSPAEEAVPVEETDRVWALPYSTDLIPRMSPLSVARALIPAVSNAPLTAVMIWSMVMSQVKLTLADFPPS